MSAPIVRPATALDLPAITAIYDHYILNSPATFDIEPWTTEQRAEWFTHYGLTGPHRVLVAEVDGAVAGAAWSSQFRTKRAYHTTVETSIYCGPRHTGLGLGRLLYTALFEGLASEHAHRAVAGVTQPNDASNALHRAFGFTPVGTFTDVGHKFERYWDVTWFEKPLD